MKLPAFFAGLAALVCLQNAQAVRLSPEGVGQALIYPYYTANGTNDTLFSISNPGSSFGEDIKAIKVRFFEGRNGRPVLQFNLYLAPRQTWTAAVTRNATGKPVLRTFDTACTVPRFEPSSAAGATEIALTNANYAGYDQAGSSLDRAKEGHFEVIEMGRVWPSFLLDSGKAFEEAIAPPAREGTAIQVQDCAAVAAAWNPGNAFTRQGGSEQSATPTGGIQGHAIIINVPQGTEYSYDPVALGDLFYWPRHTAPWDAHPNLGDADPRSSVGGVISTWSRGIDAVSAVLMHNRIRNEYVGPPTPTAPVSSDTIVNFPTRSFYVVLESDLGRSTPPFYRKFNNLDTNGGLLADGLSRGACDAISVSYFGRDGRANFVTPPPPNPVPFPQISPDPETLCWQTSVISMGNVLDSANAIHPVGFGTTSGTISISMVGFLSYFTLTSLEGHGYNGLPVTGFTMQRRINGDVGGVRANYGGTSMHKYDTWY